MKTFFDSMKKFRVLWAVALAFALMALVANASRLSREEIVYSKSLDMVLATVEGEEITLRDFAVYVAHQESAVQDQAYAYDANNTRKYWNVRTEMGFISQVARNEAMSMAIHDELFFKLYQELKIELTEEELALIKNDADDFWSDLVDEEKDTKLGITSEDVYQTMYKIACAQKAQMVYAGIKSVDYQDMNYSEEVFLAFLENYEYEVNDNVLGRLDFGDITLEHK